MFTCLELDERGASLTTFFATVMVALFLSIGLVVDGGAASLARRQCHMRATEAARAASDLGAVRRAAGATLNTEEVSEVARRYVSGTPHMTAEVSVDEHSGNITVTARLVTKTVFLSLIGINELPASHTSTVELVGVRRA